MFIIYFSFVVISSVSPMWKFLSCSCLFLAGCDFNFATQLNSSQFRCSKEALPLINFDDSKAQWSLYVPPLWHSTVLRSAHTAVFMCFVWISEQTAIISLYSINWLVCITETESVYCAVRTGHLNTIQVNVSLLVLELCLHIFRVLPY